MARTLYCWRCKMDIPMLDEREWAEVGPLLRIRPDDVGARRQSALDRYYAITGFRETEPNAIFHHRIRLYGPPCEACGKPLRTPNATWCAVCGAYTDKATVLRRHRQFMLRIDKGGSGHVDAEWLGPVLETECAAEHGHVNRPNVAHNSARWLIVLPGAIAAGIASLIPLHLVLYQTLTGSGLIEPYPELPERILGPLAATATFVWAGAKIAPSHKGKTALTLSGLAVLLGCTVLGLGLTQTPFAGQLIQLKYRGLMLIGAVAGAVLGFALALHDKSSSKSIPDEP